MAPRPTRVLNAFNRRKRQSSTRTIEEKGAMAITNIMQFSDLHLSRRVEGTVRNWEFCLSLVARERPDLVVLTGDFVLDDPDRPDDRAFAFEQIQRLTAPWVAVPGNHDVGDSVEDPYQGQAITTARRDDFLSMYKSDRWRRDIGQWTLFGLNTMLANSNLSAEREQIEWLKQELTSCSGPIVLFLHKPLCVDALDEPANPAWAISPNGRRSILGAFADADLRLVASGHLHCYRHIPTPRFDMVWAPTTSIVHSGKVRGISKTAGWVTYRIENDRVSWSHETSPTLRSIDITDLLSTGGALRNATEEQLRQIA